MTREELRQLVRESLENYNDSLIEEELSYSNMKLELEEAQINLEQCEYIEETMFDAYFEEFVLSEDYMDEDEIALIESVILDEKAKYYQNAQQSTDTRNKKHELLQAALKKKNKVREAISKVTAAVKKAAAENKTGKALTKQQILAIAKEADSENVLSAGQIQKIISAPSIAGLLTKTDSNKAENVKNIKDKVHVNKGLPAPDKVIDNAESVVNNIKNNKAQFVDDIADEVLTGDVVDVDGNVIKDKAASKIKDKLGNGFKVVNGKIVSFIKNDDGSVNKKGVAIAALATVLAGSVAAAVAVKARKKKLEKKNNENEKESNK